MQTFTFTIEQIKEIYQAGIDRGNDEATSFEWGSSPHGSKFDNCVQAIYDIINKDIEFDDEKRVGWKVIEGWFK